MKGKQAQIDKYQLVKTLGSGYHAKVKLAHNNGQYLAAKIFKSTHTMQQNLKTLKHEIGIMQKLNHPNLVNLVEVIENAKYIKKNQQTYQAMCIVLEYCAGGELFEYVSNCGAFKESVARAYFHQLIDALEYLHNHGIAHRDLKPENLLFDNNFNLKVADFGFSTLVEGKDGSGFLKTVLGTESYMAPEIHAKTPYVGSSVDLFAAAIILFIMYSGTPPFSKADPKDPYFKLLCTGRHDTFWQAHLKNKSSQEYYSKDFMNLINSMLAHDAPQRLSIAEVKSHPWYNGPVSSMDEIRTEFTNRFQKVQQAIDRERQEKLAQKEQQKKNGGNIMYGNAKFRSGEGSVNEFEGLEKQFDFTIQRQVRDVELDNRKTNDLATAIDSEYLFKYLLNYHTKYCSNNAKVEPSNKYYKIKFSDTNEDGQNLEFTVEIRKGDDDINVLDFQKLRGEAMQYFKVTNQIKEMVQAIQIKEVAQAQ